MAKTMKAARVHKFGAPLVIEDVPMPTPGPGQILVKVVASGVCHTDLHAVEGDWPVKPKLPLIPGHEGVGPVAALGAGVTDIKEGDLVGVPWLHDACGKCEYCVTGWETVCEKGRYTGYLVDGGYAEYVVAPANYVGHLPANTDLVTMAPILCAGVTVYKGLKQTEAEPGEWVVVSGIGGLGHIAVQYAKAMGFFVGAVDIHEEKLALARSLGADFTANAATEDAVAKVVKETGGGAWRVGGGGGEGRLRPGGLHGAAPRDGGPGRPAARRFPATDLRGRAEGGHGSRLDRRHAPGSRRVHRHCRPRHGQGESHH